MEFQSQYSMIKGNNLLVRYYTNINSKSVILFQWLANLFLVQLLHREMPYGMDGVLRPSVRPLDPAKYNSPIAPKFGM